MYMKKSLAAHKAQGYASLRVPMDLLINLYWGVEQATTNPAAPEGIIKAPLNDPHVTATLCLQRKDREMKCAEQRKRAQ